MSQSYPQAYVADGAIVGKDVVIEPFAYVGSNVVLKDRVCVKSHAYIDGNTEIGEDTVIYPSACIGTRSQDLKYKGQTTYVKIGKGCQIREFVTINSSSTTDSSVLVGDECYIMAYCHIAHDCKLGKQVIMANNATLAGHVIVEDYAIVGGLSAVHQFARVGTHAMIGGMSRVPKDVPPYFLGAGGPFRFGGINVVGLKRRGFSLHVRSALTHAFKLLYRSSLSLDDALEAIEETVDDIPEVRHLVAFCRQTKRGIIARGGIKAASKEPVLAGDFR